MRLRFDYRTGEGRAGRRHVEPHRLVSLRNRWYLVAFDLDRDDWRTFRIDRIGPPAETGFRNAERDAPDAAALVAEGVAVRAYDLQARVRLPVPPAVAAREIAPTIGVIETGRPDADSTVVVIGGDADWIARFLAGLPFPFEVLDSAEVRREVELLARRLLGEPAPEMAGATQFFGALLPPAGALSARSSFRLPGDDRARTPTAGRWTTRRTRRRTARRRRSAAPRCAGCRGTGRCPGASAPRSGGGRRRSAPGRRHRRARPGRTGTGR